MVEDEATTIITTIERVKAVLLPQFLQRIAAREKVMFGPLGISQGAVYYKNKEADWNEVTSVHIRSGRGYALVIYCNSFLPWCDFQILTVPNGELVYELLTRVAPQRLLKPA